MTTLAIMGRFQSAKPAEEITPMSLTGQHNFSVNPDQGITLARGRAGPTEWRRLRRAGK